MDIERLIEFLESVKVSKNIFDINFDEIYNPIIYQTEIDGMKIKDYLQEMAKSTIFIESYEDMLVRFKYNNKYEIFIEHDKLPFENYYMDNDTIFRISLNNKEFSVSNKFEDFLLDRINEEIKCPSVEITDYMDNSTLNRYNVACKYRRMTILDRATIFIDYIKHLDRDFVDGFRIILDLNKDVMESEIEEIEEIANNRMKSTHSSYHEKYENQKRYKDFYDNEFPKVEYAINKIRELLLSYGLKELKE